MDTKTAADAFSALGQPTRIEVLRRLVKAGDTGMLAGDIANALRVRQNTMSANLAVLARSGLVTSRREGRTIRYFADMEVMRDLLAFLMEDCCGGEPDKCQPVIRQLTCAC